MCFEMSHSDGCLCNNLGREKARNILIADLYVTPAFECGVEYNVGDYLPEYNGTVISKERTKWNSREVWTYGIKKPRGFMPSGRLDYLEEA